MKKSLLMIFGASCLFLFTQSCSKEDQKKGIIRFTNTSSNPYNMYINGEHKGALPGRNHKEYKLNSGGYEFKVVQISGYLLYPTERKIILTINSGDDKEFVFP
jgi:hypothetical protein